MKGPVSFKTLKFTTAQQTEGNVIELKLGQKYQLVLHLIELNDELTELNRCLEIPFEETEFITVTNIKNPVCVYDNKLS